MEQKTCISCGIPLEGEGNSIFMCPNCGEAEIARCRHCRDQSVAYTCPNCGFQGP